MIAQNHDIPVATIEQWIAVSCSNAITTVLLLFKLRDFLLPVLYYTMLL